MITTMWNPWHGCHKCSSGCLNCYVYFLDSKYNKDSNIVTKSKSSFYLPLKRDKQGNFKIPSNTEVATCFTSDFFIEEAEEWRQEVWDIIRQRNDLRFLIPTKRIHHFSSCIPNDWADDYDNVTIAVSCENQQKAEERLSILISLPIKHKQIFLSPLLEYVDLSPYLLTGQIELVSIGGESYENARICNFDWVKQIKRDCDLYQVPFQFHQTGSNFVKDGKQYHIPHSKEHDQARKAMKYLNNL